MTAGYVWYSAGSDETGPLLAEALGFEHGKKTPKPDKYPVVLGWGCKPGTTYKRGEFQKRVTMGQLRLLNAVEAIEANRNKVETLKILTAAKIPVPGFILLSGATVVARVAETMKAVQEGKIAFPLMGHNLNHKGDPAICATEEDVKHAFQVGTEHPLEYFRSFCPGTEYRIHILRDTVLLAQKKQLAEDPSKVFAENLSKDLRKKSEKDPAVREALAGGVPSVPALMAILEEAGADLVHGLGNLQRSVNRGWELVDVPLTEVPEGAKAAAISALDAVGLDLGAVSVTIDGDVARITGIATAPGLSKAHLSVYVQAIKDFCAVKEKKASAARAGVAAAKASPEIVARITQKLQGASAEMAERLLKALGGE